MNDPHYQPPSRVGRLFVAFAVPDFRLLWVYYIFNYLAMSMEMLATGWLTLEMTGSAFWVGVVAGLRGSGQVVFGIFAGVIVDRINRRLILAVTEVLRAAAFLWLGVMLVTDNAELWHLMVVAVWQGMLMAAVLPAGETLIYDTVGPSRLLNAVAITKGAFGLARIPGAILAGVIIDQAGLGLCFLVTAGLLLLAPLPILVIKTRYTPPPVFDTFWQNVLTGLKYAATIGPIRKLLLFSAVVELFGFSYFVMLPVIAKEILNVGAVELGYLSAAGSVGGLVATFILAGLSNSRSKAFLLTVAGLATGVSLFLFGLSSWYTLSLFLAGLVGLALSAHDAAMGTMLQLLSPDNMRGRILGLYSLTFGFTPLGGFVSGIIATLASAAFAVSLGGGVIFGAVSVMLAINRSTRMVEDPEPRGYSPREE